jgi:hypothetical protein
MSLGSTPRQGDIFRSTAEFCGPQPGRTSETGRHPRPGASRLTRRAVPTGPFDTNLLAPICARQIKSTA